MERKKKTDLVVKPATRIDISQNTDKQEIQEKQKNSRQIF